MMNQRTILAVSVLLLSASGVAAQTYHVSIGLFRKEPPAVVRVSGPCLISGRSRVDSGKSIVLRYSAKGVLLEGVGARSTHPSVRLKPVDPGGTVELVVDGRGRPYRGEITVRSSRGKLQVVNRLDIEDYVRSVLPGEMPHDWPLQSLAAQAVVARSFAAAGMGRHSKEGFDLCDLTHCQVYRGSSWERPETNRAVEMTSGEVLTFRSKCVPVPYHSTCGGCTTDGLYSGHPAEDYLTPVKDSRGKEVYCSASNHYRWSWSLSSDELKRATEADGRPVPGEVADVRVSARDASGRATVIEIRADRLVKVTACDFMLAAGRHLGWNKIKSTFFDVRKSNGRFVFTGRGLGHGMGLCQWGARGMALRGRSYGEILKHYYPKCVVSRRYH